MKPCYLGVSYITQPEIRWLPEFQQVMGPEQQNFFLMTMYPSMSGGIS